VSLLDDILTQKRSELNAIRQLTGPFAPRDVCSSLRRGVGDPLRLAAEIKFKSPSAGNLSTVLSLEARALAYAEAGVSLISVLCDERFFGGSFSHLSRVRTALETAGHEARVLAKEFVIDQAQIRAAASMGADAVLLIVRILQPEELAAMTAFALGLGIEPIVEIVDEGELARACAAGARVIGVNARDLDTLQMDQDRAERVLAAIPKGIVAMHLSGLREASDVTKVARGRADAALIGEALMRCDDPRALLGEVVRAATSARG
jgi:indole-3-glycerol phosphate synthase